MASGLVDSDLLMEALLHHAAPRQAIDSPMLNPRFRQRKAPSIGRLQWSVQHSSRRIAIQDLDAVGAMEDSDTWRCLVSDMVFDSSSTRFNGSGEQHRVMPGTMPGARLVDLHASTQHRIGRDVQQRVAECAHLHSVAYNTVRMNT